MYIEWALKRIKEFYYVFTYKKLSDKKSFVIKSVEWGRGGVVF